MRIQCNHVRDLQQAKWNVRQLEMCCVENAESCAIYGGGPAGNEIMALWC